MDTQINPDGKTQMNTDFRGRKVILFSTFCFLFSMLLVGCTDNRYRAEKLFWEIEQKVQEILKNNPQGLTAKDYNEIIASYQKVVDTFPLEPFTAQVQFLIVDIYLTQKKYARAQEILADIAENFSLQPEIASEALFKKGNIFELKNKWERALKCYEKIYTFYPLSSLGLEMPIYILQHYQTAQNRAEEDIVYQRGIKHYTKLLDDYSETKAVPILKSRLASLHYVKGNVKDAIVLWDEIIENYPNDPLAREVLLKKGKFYADEKKDLEAAIDTYNVFIEKYPQAKEAKAARLKLAELYLENKQSDKAKEIYSTLIKESSQDKEASIQAYLGLASCYQKEANMDKVIEIYEKIRKDYPQSEAALAIPFLTAEFYQKMRYASKAYVALQKAISFYETIVNDSNRKEGKRLKEAKDYLALCYIKNKNFDKALKLLRELSNTYPHQPNYLIKIAAIYHNLHAFDKAMDIYKELADKYPKNEILANLSKKQIRVLKERLSQ